MTLNGMVFVQFLIATCSNYIIYYEWGNGGKDCPGYCRGSLVVSGTIFVTKCCYLNRNKNEKQLNKPGHRNGCGHNRTNDIMR